jgi:predicted dehydrogenase
MNIYENQTVKKLRLGVIGTGSVVREIYEYLYFDSVYSPLISVEAICDRNEENMKLVGDKHNIPVSRRFTDYRDLISNVPIDAVTVNTPDHFHKEPAVFALEAGLDVLLPKPIADNVKDAHAIIAKAKQLGRFIGVDFHKREDPRIKEAKARFRQGDYGKFQSSVWYMLDKLMVSDPNHVPRFFATADFAAINSPVSFLTVHMADAFMTISGLKPLSVKAVGYKQKLPSLKPLAVDGYDLVDTEIFFENGGVCHIITGWAIPNSAHALTVQSARIIGSEGLLDLNLDLPGYHEVIAGGIFERNPLFRNFEPDGKVSGYGIQSAGKIIENMIGFRNSQFSTDEIGKLMDPFSLGFYATLVCEGAHRSLENGVRITEGVVSGGTVNLKNLLEREIGKTESDNYYKN